ncbi:hypothetical protein [Nostoc sp.]|uniref:hypothetical protein n=1 Tax=Nostoc sp. TaxID=1180 RepID=UPI002FF7194D
MNLYYTAIAQRANHCCEYCQAPEVVFNFRLRWSILFQFLGNDYHRPTLVLENSLHI